MTHWLVLFHDHDGEPHDIPCECPIGVDHDKNGRAYDDDEVDE